MDVAISGRVGSSVARSATSCARRSPGVAAGARRHHRTATTSAGIPEAGVIDAAALEGVDAVVHLAGEGIAEKKWSDEQKRRILESRVRGTVGAGRRVASRERKPRVFVSGSASGTTAIAATKC